MKFFLGKTCQVCHQGQSESFGLQPASCEEETLIGNSGHLSVHERWFDRGFGRSRHDTWEIPISEKWQVFGVKSSENRWTILSLSYGCSSKCNMRCDNQGNDGGRREEECWQLYFCHFHSNSYEELQHNLVFRHSQGLTFLHHTVVSETDGPGFHFWLRIHTDGLHRAPNKTAQHGVRRIYNARLSRMRWSTSVSWSWIPSNGCPRSINQSVNHIRIFLDLRIHHSLCFFHFMIYRSSLTVFALVFLLRPPRFLLNNQWDPQNFPSPIWNRKHFLLGLISIAVPFILVIWTTETVESSGQRALSPRGRYGVVSKADFTPVTNRSSSLIHFLMRARFLWDALFQGKCIWRVSQEQRGVKYNKLAQSPKKKNMDLHWNQRIALLKNGLAWQMKVQTGVYSA
jgi:hypothetical protein